MAGVASLAMRNGRSFRSPRMIGDSMPYAMTKRYGSIWVSDTQISGVVFIKFRNTRLNIDYESNNDNQTADDREADDAIRSGV